MLIAAANVISLLLTMLYAFLALGSCALPVPAPIYAVQTDIPLPAEEGRRLAILSARGDASHSLLRAANLFMLENPGVIISVQTIGAETDYGSALRSRLLSGERVDIFHIFGHSDMIELKSHLEDLSDLYWAENAIADTLEPVSADGRFFGIPYSVEGIGLIANRRIFDAAGVSLSGVNTFDELEDVFRDLREKITSGELRADFPLLESVTSLPGMDDDFLSRQLADIAIGGEFSTSASAVRAASISYSNAQAMGLYVSLLARYTTHGRAWTMLMDIHRSDQVENGLAIERVAVIQQNVQVGCRILDVNSELGRHLLLLPIPLDGADHGYIYTHAPIYWAVNSGADAEAKSLAREFLTWLYRSETGARFIAEEMRVLSPFRDTGTDTANPLHNQLLSYINQGRYLPRRHRDFPQGWAVNSFANALRDYFTVRELTWDEVVRRKMQDWIYTRIG